MTTVTTTSTSAEPRPWRHNPEIIDLGHPDVFVGGVRHDAFAVLRRDYPVYWNEEPAGWGPGFWNVTRHEDIVAVSRDPGLFSSAQGINITYHPSMDPKIVNALIGGMITMDPPAHNAYRKVALPFFTKSALDRLESRIREVARDVVTAAAERGECDFMKDVAAPLPVAVLCEILGVPDEDHDKIFEWSNLLVGGIDPDLGVSQENVIPIYLQLFAYGQRLIEDRRRTPRGDLMTAIANARMEDGAADPRGSPQRLLPADGDRRQRDHAQLDRRRHGGADRSTPISIAACAPTRRCCPPRSRRSCAGCRRCSTCAARRRARPRSAACRSPRATRW